MLPGTDIRLIIIAAHQRKAASCSASERLVIVAVTASCGITDIGSQPIFSTACATVVGRIEDVEHIGHSHSAAMVRIGNTDTYQVVPAQGTGVISLGWIRNLHHLVVSTGGDIQVRLDEITSIEMYPIHFLRLPDIDYIAGFFIVASGAAGSGIRMIVHLQHIHPDKVGPDGLSVSGHDLQLEGIAAREQVIQGVTILENTAPMPGIPVVGREIVLEDFIVRVRHGKLPSDYVRRRRRRGDHHGERRVVQAVVIFARQ